MNIWHHQEPWHFIKNRYSNSNTYELLLPTKNNKLKRSVDYFLKFTLHWTMNLFLWHKLTTYGVNIHLLRIMIVYIDLEHIYPNENTNDILYFCSRWFWHRWNVMNTVQYQYIDEATVVIGSPLIEYPNVHWRPLDFQLRIARQGRSFHNESISNGD